MSEETYTITETQWKEVNSALLVAVGVCGLHAKAAVDQMIKASIVMDDIIDASEGEDEGDDN